MLNALTRFCTQKHTELQIQELTRAHWIAIEPNNRFGQVAEHEVWMQDEIPSHDKWKEGLTIYDGRQAELLFKIRQQEREEPSRPGFSKMPSQITFSFGSRNL